MTPYIIGFTALVMVAAALTACQSEPSRPSDSGSRPIPGDTMERLTGTLKSGFAGIGGEHTGWALVVGTGVGGGAANAKQIEVDVSGVSEGARTVDGKAVTIVGRYQDRKRVERGMTKVFVVSRIE